MTRTREETFEQLYSILKRCQKKGWDGYKAEPVNTKSAVNTILFLVELPKDIEGACIICDQDGNLNMVWTTSIAYRIKHKKPALWFSVKVETQQEKTISISGFGYGEHTKLLNTTYDFSNGIPDQVIELLREITKLNAMEKQ
jgi:hypothetical protein